MLMPKEQLGRANALVLLAASLAQIMAPLSAGVLLQAIGMTGIVAITAMSMMAAMLTLLLVQIPQAAKPIGLPSGPAKRGIEGFSAAYHFLRGHPGMLTMTAYSALASFILGGVVVLLRPMILAAHSEMELGMLLSAGGIGTMLGSIVMVARGTPNRLVLAMLCVDTVLGLSIAATGWFTSLSLACLCVSISMICGPILRTCGHTLWQRKVPLHLQGRVFALQNLLANGATPAAAVMGSILADRVFEPWLMPGGLLADSLGIWTGVGPGRGIGVMFMTAGLALAATALVALLRPRFRTLDLRLPDAH
jgi:hypothetical protein